jgi:hypothetical protein
VEARPLLVWLPWPPDGELPDGLRSWRASKDAGRFTMRRTILANYYQYRPEYWPIIGQ